MHELGFESEAAIACYDEALAIDGHHGEALFRLAVNVDLRGEDEEARELYERALMIPPVNEACVINLGILYEDMGKYLRAMQCFDLALQANPENRRARMYRRDAAAARPGAAPALARYCKRRMRMPGGTVLACSVRLLCSFRVPA